DFARATTDHGVVMNRIHNTKGHPVSGWYFRSVWLFAVGWVLCCLVGPAAVPEDPEGPYVEAYLRGDYAEALATLETIGGTSTRELPLFWAVDRAELLYIQGRTQEALMAMGDVAQSIQEPCYTV